jgi:PKHD-type hydroxylase
VLLHLRGLLTAAEAQEYSARLEDAAFEDGRATARGRAKDLKHNLQVAPSDPIARELAQRLRDRLLASDVFTQVAQPRRMLPLRFCKYVEGMRYGSHLDLPTMAAPGGGMLRTDVSLTVFLTPRASYDGGSLVFSSDFGERVIDGDAGDAVLYPSDTLHRVEEVTRGTRLVAISWIESLVRDTAQRRLLFELVENIRRLEAAHGASAETTALRRCHYSLVRLWSDT